MRNLRTEQFKDLNQDEINIANDTKMSKSLSRVREQKILKRNINNKICITYVYNYALLIFSI